jgi:branched-chain amino acid transport system permease protein
MASHNDTTSAKCATDARLLTTTWRGIGTFAVLAIAFILPFGVSGYRIFQFSQVLIYGVAILGLNILTGFSGQISLGHSAFYAIGAYTSAILLGRTGIPYWASVPMAGAVCLGFGFLFGLPAGEA